MAGRKGARRQGAYTVCACEGHDAWTCDGEGPGCKDVFAGLFRRKRICANCLSEVGKKAVRCPKCGARL